MLQVVHRFITMARLNGIWGALGLTSLIGLSCPIAMAQQPGELQSLVQSHCVDCHRGEASEANLDLTRLEWNPSEPMNRDRWIRVIDRVRRGEMPPNDTIPSEEVDRFVEWGESTIIREIRSTYHREGRTLLRRLNRREFENSLHNLLGIDTPLQHLLPVDSKSSGFDTVSDGLRMSAMQIEKYLEAIDVGLDATFRLTENPKRIDSRFHLRDEKEIRENLDKAEGETDSISGSKHKRLFHEREDAIVFISSGWSPDVLRQFMPEVDGVYRVRISAYAVHSRGEPITLRVYLSDWKTHRLVEYFEMPDDEPRVVEFTLPVSSREHFRINGHGIGIDASGKSVWNVDTVKDWEVPGLAVQWVEVTGPLDEDWPPAGLKRLVGADHIRKLEQLGRWTPHGHIGYELAAADPEAVVQEVVESFATRAFRRPLRQGEVDRFVKLANEQLTTGGSLEQALRVGMRSLLISPQFLYLEETPGEITGGALAARLSFFLWSAPPDDELLRIAESGRLADREALRQQVDRLLDSPRSAAFVRSFLGQWLDLNQIDATTPDTALYPEYDEMLRASMIKETEAFFGRLLKEDLSVSNVIDSDFLMLDRRMSLHYGIPLPEESSESIHFGEQFRQVAKPTDSPRGGIVTQAAILKVTANGTVTSPVVRGSWILRHILGTPPQPPPPVPAIEPDTRGATTIREQLAKHRDVETCNRCHSKIDPPGFALEAFDVIGGYRQRYRSVGKGDPAQTKLFGRDIWEYRLGLPVDCSGETADGKPFQDIRQFKKLLLEDEKQITTNLAVNLIAYGTGAGVTLADREEVERIVEKVSERGSGVRSLIQEIVASQLFRSK